MGIECRKWETQSCDEIIEQACEGGPMAPFIVLVVSIAVFWLAGRAGVPIFQDASFVLRAALAVMFFLTASAHWGKRREVGALMVPPAEPRHRLHVTISIVHEIQSAIGQHVPENA